MQMTMQLITISQAVTKGISAYEVSVQLRWRLESVLNLRCGLDNVQALRSGGKE